MRPALLALLASVVLVLPAQAGDAPTISAKKGKKGGVVVLWPRVVPEEAPPEVHELAAGLQAELERLAQGAVDPGLVTLRPEPERVCPQDGCRAVSLGAVLGHHEGGCFAVGLVGLPDAGHIRMVPWAGEVLATRRHVAHREPPESELVVTEFVPCDDLIPALDSSRIERALQKASSDPAGPDDD